MKGGEHGALCGKDELGKGGWNLGLCSALKLPASLPGPQLCGAKGGPHGGDRGGDEHGEGVPSGRPSGKAGAAGAVSASRFPGLSRPLPVALGTAGQTHLSSWQALMLAHRLGSLTAPDSRKAFSYLGSGVRRGLGDSPWLLRPRVRPPGFSLPVVQSLGFRGNRMGGFLPRDNQCPHPGHPTHHIPAQDSPALLQEEPQRPGADPQRGGLQLCGDGAGRLHMLRH